jgi:hypothetical protein
VTLRAFRKFNFIAKDVYIRRHQVQRGGVWDALNRC